MILDQLRPWTDYITWTCTILNLAMWGWVLRSGRRRHRETMEWLDRAVEVAEAHERMSGGPISMALRRLRTKS